MNAACTTPTTVPDPPSPPHPQSYEGVTEELRTLKALLYRQQTQLNAQQEILVELVEVLAAAQAPQSTQDTVQQHPALVQPECFDHQRQSFPENNNNTVSQRHPTMQNGQGYIARPPWDDNTQTSPARARAAAVTHLKPLQRQLKALAKLRSRDSKFAQNAKTR
jgi:hypothetical protein